MADDVRSDLGSSITGTDQRPISKNSLAMGDQVGIGAGATFREALQLHLGELQSKLAAEHELRLSPENQRLEQLVESLKAENECLKKLVPKEDQIPKPEKRDKSQLLRDACWMMRENSMLDKPSTNQIPRKSFGPPREVSVSSGQKVEQKRSASVRKSAAAAKHRSRRSSMRGTSVYDLRPMRHDSQELGSISSMDRQVESLLRTALAAWKEFTFQYIRDEDDDDSEQEVEALRQAAYKEWPEDPNSNEWQAQLFRTDLARTMSGDLSASKDQRLSAGSPFWRKHLVTYPSSRKRMCWDLLGLILVIWDIFAIPMNAFELTDIVSLYIMSWVSTVFWTVDFPTNFFLGFYRAGHIVTSPWAIALQYLRTWFSIDVGVLALDWFFIFLDLSMGSVEEDTDAAGNNYFRIARMSRGLKVLRILRLVRLAKLFPKFHSAFIVVQSDAIRLSMGAWFAVVIVVVMNHYVACAWFALGYWSTEAPITWVRTYDLNGVRETWKLELAYQYFTSLHWALCQFTPATMEVMATNTAERIFTVLTIILGLISFSSFVSNITTSMTQLRNLNSEKHKLQSSLRTYFSQNEVPPEVSKCIYEWISSHRKVHRLRVHEKDIELLADMPQRLRCKLREAVYGPVMCRHPFLQEFREVDQRGFDRLCHQALQEMRISTEHTVFLKKDQAVGMYFVTGGDLDYWKSALQEPVPVSTGDWLAEVALWVQWRHCGTLSAKCASDVIILDADLFRSVLSGCSRITKRLTRSYAAAFVRHDCEAVQPNGWLSDLCCSHEAIHALKESVRNGSGSNSWLRERESGEQKALSREADEAVPDSNEIQSDSGFSRQTSSETKQISPQKLSELHSPVRVGTPLQSEHDDARCSL